MIDFTNIPKNIQEAIIYSVDLEKTVQEIASRHQLQLDQAGDLFDSIVSVFTGDLRATDFVGDIEYMLGINHDQAAKLAEEVNRLIFVPVKESIQGVEEPMEQAEEIIDVISNPENMGLKTRTVTPDPERIDHQMPQEKPVHQKKLEGAQTLPAQETETVNDQRLKIIPQEVKERINNDPYKESI
jgi:hypothetical protein